MCHGGLLLIRVSELTERNTSQFSTAVTFLCGFRSFSRSLFFPSSIFGGRFYFYDYCIYIFGKCVCVCVERLGCRRKGDGIMAMFDSVTGSY